MIFTGQGAKSCLDIYNKFLEITLAVDLFKNSGTSSASVKYKTFTRLPRNVLPVSYNITLKPDLNRFVFDGSVSIAIKVNEVSRTIKLDSQELDIKNPTFTVTSTGEVLRPIKVQTLADEERLEFVFDEDLPLGNNQFHCDFHGKLDDSLRGFYRSKGKNQRGEDSYAAVSHFEPIDAHRAFPCWDEPALKATFNMTLIVQKDLLALSNTRPIAESPYEMDQSWKVVRFETTPKMSTYLVAAVVGHHDYVEDYTKSNVRVRVYTSLGKREQGRYALHTAVKSLDFLEEYFNVSYPLSKADLVAVADFAAGAMENWGLITCRETTVLYDPMNSSTNIKQNVATVVTHELGHMWFGNLVTMEWWTYLWLNEGFAKFMESLTTDHIYPDYDMWTQFVAETLNVGLNLDSLDSSHPVEVIVEHPAMVEEIFDNIAYEKGASIIRMLNSHLGADKFRAGMQLYLNRHKYSNTLSSDLWKALEEVSSVRVESVMNSWVKQVGFPVIQVTALYKGDNIVLNLRQNKFYSQVDNPKRNEPQPLWKVPIPIAWGGNSTGETKILLEAQETEVTLEGAVNASWIQVNHGAVSFFRTMYSREMLAGLLDAVKSKTLSAENRFILHADLFALVQSGYRNTTELLEFTKAYENETDFSTWNSVAILLSKMSLLLGDDVELVGKLHKFGAKLFRNIFKSVGWDTKPGEKHTTALLRTVVLSMLVTFNDAEILAEARTRFNAYVDGRRILSADIRSPVYHAVAKTVDSTSWAQLIKLHKEANLQEEAERILIALGDVPTPEYIQKVLNFADSSEVRAQDAISVIASVSTSAQGRDLAWKHYQANHKRYSKRYNSGFLISRLIKGVTENFKTFEKAKEVEQFFANRAIPGTELTIKQTIESIISNAKWLQRDQKVIEEFLRRHGAVNETSR
ncbi:puromycin-sensitive aminopeptidase-like isoform X2 [Varroa jacobsoni]|uniref:puromycin-sensitive aminopeptidase-like isoform X2 n=1 Tax=Varroa jacobsoni TaxID=62625 RepID=UPI000BF516BA|nr:puromycin-sensitive aminopeptidase-like isoform X2 [Varroa jacobsoni]